MRFMIETEQEEDGRWLAEVMDVPGAMVYGASRAEAEIRAHVLALHVVLDRIQHGESTGMGKYEKLLLQILRGSSDTSVAFEDLRHLLFRLGFDERVSGSHHIFRKEGVEEMINLQRSGSSAKPYQIRQVRAIIAKYGIGGDE